MPYSYTGIIYLFTALVFGIGAYKFYKVWQEQKNFISKIFAYLMGLIAAFLFLDGLFGGIIFVNNQEVGDFVTAAGFLPGAFISGILGYLAFYLKFSQISPKYGFFLMFSFSIIVGIINVIYPTHTFFEPSKFINWEVHPLVGILRSLTFIIPSIPITIVFFQQAKSATEKRIKIRSFLLGTTFAGGVIGSTYDLLISGFAKSNAMISDLTLAVVSFAILLVFLFIPTVGYVPHVKKIE